MLRIIRMKHSWPERYINLSDEQKETVYNEICRLLLEAIKDQENPIPAELTITPTLQITLGNGGWHSEHDMTLCTHDLIEQYLSVDQQAVRKLVEDSLFKYPDFEKMARENARISGQEVTDEQIHNLAEELYGYMKFDMDSYLQAESRVSDYPVPTDDSPEAFYEWDQLMFGPHDHCEGIVHDSSDPEDDDLDDAIRNFTIEAAEDCIRTSFHNDTVHATVQDMHSVLNYLPYTSTGDGKCVYSWEAVLKDHRTGESTFFTVYDYKHPGPIYYDKPIDWHIGAHTAEDSHKVKAFLQQLLDLPF